MGSATVRASFRPHSLLDEAPIGNRRSTIVLDFLRGIHTAIHLLPILGDAVMKSLSRRETHSVIATAVVFLSLPLSAQGQEDAADTAQVKALLAQGNVFYKQGNFAKTHSYLDDALRIKPKSYQLLAMRGFLNSQEGKFGPAVEDLKYAAIFARAQGKIDESRNLFAKALEFESMITNYSKNQAEQAKAQPEAAVAKTQTQTNLKTKTGNAPAQRKSISSTARSVSQ